MSFTGDQITLTSYFPAENPQDVLFSSSAVVNGGVTFSPSNYHVNPPSPGHTNILPTIYFGSNSILIQYSPSNDGQHFSSGGFNGLVFQTASGDQPIGEVHLVSTNIPGFTDQNIEVTAHSISINVQNLSLPSSPTGGSIKLVAGFGPPFYEVNNTGQPIKQGNPLHITITGDGLPADLRPLLVQAERAWEGFANIHFDDVTGNAAAERNADIQVGLAFLHPSTTHELGDTTVGFNGTTIGKPVHVTIENPQETKLLPLQTGDQFYQGTQVTVLQDLIHELGHALGLAENPIDPRSIMNPNLNGQNVLISPADATAIEQLYGVPPGQPPVGLGI